MRCHNPEDKQFHINRYELTSTLTAFWSGQSLAFSTKRYDMCVKTFYSCRTVVEIKVGIAGIKRIGKRRFVYKFYWKNLKERDHLEDPCVDGVIILRWLFSKWDGGHGLE